MNGFSTLVICISGLKENLSETINSLTFAQKVMNLKNNPKILPVLQPDNKVSLCYKLKLEDRSWLDSCVTSKQCFVSLARQTAVLES